MARMICNTSVENTVEGFLTLLDWYGETCDEYDRYRFVEPFKEFLKKVLKENEKRRSDVARVGRNGGDGRDGRWIMIDEQ